MAASTELQLGRYRLRGASLAGMYTSLHVPALDALFDVGIALRQAATVGHIFLSHGHMDHIGALPALLGMRGLVGRHPPPRIFAPTPVVEALGEAIEAFSKLQRWPLPIQLEALEPGDERQLRKDLWVKAFRTLHADVPSLGYLFFDRTARLRPEFWPLPAAELRERRLRGDDLFTTEDRLLFAYATDTLPEVLDQVPELARVPVLVLECSFLDGRKPIAAARAGGHIHLDELLPYTARLENEALCLMHFSQLYKPTEVRRILEERWPQGGRAVPLLPTDATTWWS